ncbi:MAG: DUF4040 domain-containing protein [Cyanobacteria bacterium J06642_2]
MTEDVAIVAIAALLPLTAYMTVAQTNPYHALVIRGIMGAVAALVYAAFGAADVALTEALVGTMLSITLYAVAVRSSLTTRLGVLESAVPNQEKTPKVIALSTQASEFELAIASIRKALSSHHVRLKVITYADTQTLKTAFHEREVHGTFEASSSPHLPYVYHFKTRVRRLHDIIQPELPSHVSLAHVDLASTDQLEPQATHHDRVSSSGEPA